MAKNPEKLAEALCQPRYLEELIEQEFEEKFGEKEE